MQLDIFKKILEVDSTSGKERALSEFLKGYFPDLNGECVCRSFEVGDGTENLLFRWKCGDSQQDNGRLPKVVLCSHLDTVPPYIEPNVKEIRGGEALPDGNVSLNFQDTLITGRGSCDAKGQFFAMWTACEELAKELKDVRTASGYHDFGLLLLSGEETGSFGAKAFTRDCPGAEWIIVGEPTDNCMVTASKGTQSFQVTIKGKACHSGYPELGHSAVDTFIDIDNRLAVLYYIGADELLQILVGIILRIAGPHDVRDKPAVADIHRLVRKLVDAPRVRADSRHSAAKLLPGRSVPWIQIHYACQFVHGQCLQAHSFMTHSATNLQLWR